MTSRIECQHDCCRAPIVQLRLSNNVSLLLCEDCYDALKGEVIQDVLRNLAREFAKEMSRLDFSKR